MQNLARLSLFAQLVVIIVPLGILHHIDHVLRADHAGWPFRPEVTAFTFTLLIYPLLALAWSMGAKPWLRAGIMGIIALFVLGAHTLIEPPQQIYGTWANNRSTDAVLYTVDLEHVHNLLNIESPLLGIIAALLSIALTAVIIIAFIVAVRDALRSDNRLASRTSMV
jgi:hypothetical protein